MILDHFPSKSISSADYFFFLAAFFLAAFFLAGFFAIAFKLLVNKIIKRYRKVEEKIISQKFFTNYFQISDFIQVKIFKN